LFRVLAEGSFEPQPEQTEVVTGHLKGEDVSGGWRPYKVERERLAIISEV
jgi:hypothetical protein